MEPGSRGIYGGLNRGKQVTDRTKIGCDLVRVSGGDSRVRPGLQLGDDRWGPAVSRRRELGTGRAGRQIVSGLGPVRLGNQFFS